MHHLINKNGFGNVIFFKANSKLPGVTFEFCEPL